MWQKPVCSRFPEACQLHDDEDIYKGASLSRTHSLAKVDELGNGVERISVFALFGCFGCLLMHEYLTSRWKVCILRPSKCDKATACPAS